MNVVNLIGRLGKDPDVRITESGMTVVKFSLAINRPPTKDGTKITDWIQCVAFSKTADVIKTYVKKGDQLGVEGRIQTGSYNHKDGYKVYTTDILVNRIHFISSNKNDNHEEEKQMLDDRRAKASEEKNEDVNLPF